MGGVLTTPTVRALRELAARSEDAAAHAARLAGELAPDVARELAETGEELRRAGKRLRLLARMLEGTAAGDVATALGAAAQLDVTRRRAQ